MNTNTLLWRTCWLAFAFGLGLPCALSQQVSIGRIDQMPNLPSPYQMRIWKQVTLAFDSIAFDQTRSGQYLPLIQQYANTVNYPAQGSFRIQSYVGSPSFGGEAVTCLPALVGASLVGIDKSNQNGTNWILMAGEWFNKANGQNVYLNSPSSATGDDWWYETMPNVFFYQLASMYPTTGDFPSQLTTVAGRWRAAVAAMGGSTTPWSIANVNHRAFNLATMKSNDSGVPEPEAAGAIAWILYCAYVRTGRADYRIGAELALESLLVYTTNPSYELQLPYGTYVAARMNAEIGTTYDITKMMNWCFSDGNQTLRNWGAIVGRWGLYDCSGLIGESNTPNLYGFFMNVVEQAGALVPMVRYDDRYARAVGKWVLNATNALRLLYPDYLPDDHQDSQVWAHQYDPTDAIAHEALHQYNPANPSITPYGTGDAIAGGWAQTNLGLYGSAHVGIFGALIDTTNIPMILRLDLLKTDYFHGAAYPSYLYFNPYNADTAVVINVGSTACDLYNTVTKSYLRQNVSGTTTFTLAANSAAVVVLVPTGGSVSYDLEEMLINGVVVDYHSGHALGNYPPRIKSLSPDSSHTLLGGSLHIYCTATDRDSVVLTYAWSASRGTISGTGPVVSWKAPDSPAVCTLSCTVSDGRGGVAMATDTVQVLLHINQPPVIRRILPVPRKVNLGAASQLICTASDPDTNTLSYTWGASGGSFTGTGPVVTWHAPTIAGDYWIRCTVDDGQGGRTVDSTGCEVRDLSVVQSGDLVAFYPFSGDASDASTHNRNGVATNLQPAADRFGKANSAYAFNGTNSVIVVPNDSGLDFQASISVNLWVEASAFYPSREQYIISHGNWQNRWKISVTPGTNTVRWTVKNSSGMVKDLDSQSPLVLDSLVNLTAVYDGAEMEIYFNGQLDAFAPFAGPINTTTIALVIGQDLPTDTQYGFSGILDDVRLYNYALPLATIAGLYDLTAVRGVSGPGLPVALELLQNYPNPFNPSTTVTFAVPGALSSRRVSLRVYDVLGREVATLVDGSLPAGRYSVVWGAGALASGVYLCRLASEGTVRVEKMILMK